MTVVGTFLFFVFLSVSFFWVLASTFVSCIWDCGSFLFSVFLWFYLHPPLQLLISSMASFLSPLQSPYSRHLTIIIYSLTVRSFIFEL